jgi:drug/metabolite transporter (DMT)-like permease
MPETFVIVLVLVAAVLHAVWNALVKAGSDKVATQALMSLFASLPALAALPFLPLPLPAAWPMLAVSTVVHLAYYFSLVSAYRAGDLSQVYPIARGTSPLLVGLGAWAFAGESMSAIEMLGVAIVCAGIVSLTARRGLSAHERRAIGFALATSVTIGLYSVADGMGVRRAGEPLSYIAWLLALEAPLAIAAGLWLRRGRIVVSFRAHARNACIGGTISALGYGIVIWAMGRLPLAQVSALRETSVIIAAAIGALLLRESFGPRRIAAAVMVAGGNALMHL